MAGEVDAALRALDADDAVRAVVITGAGRAFCAGADLGRGGDSFAPRDAPPEPGARQTAFPERVLALPDAKAGDRRDQRPRDRRRHHASR